MDVRAVDQGGAFYAFVNKFTLTSSVAGGGVAFSGLSVRKGHFIELEGDI